MNLKLEAFKKNIQGKKVAVLGIGISNTPLIKYLAALGVEITAFDKATREQLKDTLAILEGLKVEYRLGEDYLSWLKGFDIIFKTPKVRFDIPELEAERARGAEITSEMEVFVELCPAEIFAVTGSVGKTTTTTLIYKILCEQGYKCWLGGNIGTPLLDRIDEIMSDDKVVLELSSFQLHTMRQNIDTAVILNISPNHLDVHNSMEEYVDAKKNIFRYQRPECRVILNYDDEITRNFAAETSGKEIFFGRINKLGKGAYVENGAIVYKDGQKAEYIVKVDDILLPGVHNVENYLAATATVIERVKPEAISKIAMTFAGVEHRMELVREVNGVRYFNDSKATTPSSTIAAMNSFNQRIILIAGGYDKHTPYDEMGKDLAEKVKSLILIGPTSKGIYEALKAETEKTGRGADIQVYFCQSFEETVARAYETAQKGDIVVLSPASASFDLFKNFEERGNRFKELVNRL